MHEFAVGRDTLSGPATNLPTTCEGKRSLWPFGPRIDILELHGPFGPWVIKVTYRTCVRHVLANRTAAHHHRRPSHTGPLQLVGRQQFVRAIQNSLTKRVLAF